MREDFRQESRTLGGRRGLWHFGGPKNKKSQLLKASAYRVDFLFRACYMVPRAGLEPALSRTTPSK